MTRVAAHVAAATVKLHSPSNLPAVPDAFIQSRRGDSDATEGSMQFRWTDISNVDQPGTYLLPNDTRIKIDAKHIVMWTHDPDGVFDAFLYPGDKKRAAEYTLTDFHPSEDLVG
jgi:hypothetical protein